MKTFKIVVRVVAVFYLVLGIYNKAYFEAILFFTVFWYCSKPRLSRIQYLFVLSCDDWKSGRQVKKDIEKKFKTSISPVKPYIVMAQLEEAGLVISRDVKAESADQEGARPVREFQLTWKGAGLLTRMQTSNT